MKKTKGTGIFRKVSWMIGFLLLVYGSIVVNNHYKDIASSTFDGTSFYWTTAITSIVMGAYIALIFMKQPKLQLNLGLFICVTIPCLLLTFYYPILAIAPTFVKNVQFLMSAPIIRLTSENIFGVVAGLTLVLSLYKQKEK